MKNYVKKLVSVVLAASMSAGMLSMMPGTVSAANGLGTYEVETLEGAELWTSIYETQLPGYSGEGFAYLTSNSIELEIEIEEEGMYQIDVRACQILSEEGRMQTISINGIDYTYNMPYIDAWKDVTFGVFRLKKGTNTITLKPQYGYGAYDTLTVSKAELSEVKGTNQTVDAKATPETKALMKYLASVYGKNVLSGQQEIYGGGHGMQTNIRYDAAADQCVDSDGKTYIIDEDSRGEDKDGNPVVWTCYDENGQKYDYNEQNRGYTYNDYDMECRYLKELTGDYPAIRGFDFNCHNPGFAWEDGVTDRMIKWAKENNGICTASWHVTVPRVMANYTPGEPADWSEFTYDTKTDFVTKNALIEGTAEYDFFQEAMKLLAEQLLKLQDAGVPVIFRPLHEAEGNPGQNGDGSGAWFWWSKEGAETYNALWKLLYTTLTEEYGVHNLIWEQNLYAWSDESALWYTGPEWVDIVGFDKYNTEYNRHDGNPGNSGPNEDAESKIFWSLVDYVDNEKMVAMPENDSIPSLENMQIEQAKWLYFCTWYDGEAGAPQFISGEKYQNPETLKTLFQSDYCITLSELPKDLYTYTGSNTDPTAPTDETKPTPTDDDTTAPAPDGVVYGDVNEDGEIGIMDVILLNRNLMVGAKISEQGMINADVNKDGKTDAVDSLNILKAVVQLITLPVE